MLDYLSILKMHYLQKLSCREICASVGCGKTAVSKFLNRFEENENLKYPLPPEITNEQLEELLYRKRGGAKEIFAPVDCGRIYTEMAGKGQTLQRLWNKYRRYCENTPSSPQPYSYRQFCQKYQNYLETKGLTGRVIRYPGQNIEVDYAGKVLYLKNPVTGRNETKVTIFVGTLSFSKYYYAEGMLKCSIDEWLDVNTNMIRWFGGVTPVITPDNCKVAVTKNNSYADPVLNKDYREWAEYYGTALLPARVKAPDDKPNIEGGVKIVTQEILADMDEMTFFTLDELNKELWTRIDILNSRLFSKRDRSRREIFMQEEKPMLIALPENDFVRLDRQIVRVAPDCHITYNYCHYSVPHKYMKSDVEVRASATKIDIYTEKGTFIRSWPKASHKGEYETEPSHLPKNFSDYNSWSVPFFLSIAGRIGPSTKAVIKAVFDRAKYPCQYFRQAAGITGFAKKYGNEALEKCCLKALESGRCNYTFIKNTVAEFVSPDSPVKNEQKKDSEHSHDKYAVDNSKYRMEELLKRQEVLS